jgi:hypothetical protein
VKAKMSNNNNRLILIRAISLAAAIVFLGGASFAQRGGDATTNINPDTGNASRQELRRFRIEASKLPWIGVVVKDLPNSSRTKGVLVESVVTGSPADKAGIREKDIIVSLAGNQVNSANEFTRIAQSLRIGNDYPLAVIRDGSKIDIIITPTSRPTADSNAASTSTGAIVSDVPAPRKGFLDINVLKYAFIDPKTHEITFVGRYDPAYNTGPIPYADLLQTALANPYPSFSLEPTKQSRETFNQVDKMVDADIDRMSDPNYCNQWAQKLLNLLIYDNSLQADNRRFFRNCAEALGITPDELRRLYEGAVGKINVPNNELFQLVAKLMRGIGSPSAADGMLALAAGGTPEEILRNMAEAFGITAQYEELERKNLSAEQFRVEAIILCISEMCRKFEAPESGIQSRVSAIRSGSQSVDTLIDYMGQQMSEFISKRAGRKMINGLVLGPEVLSKMYNTPAPQVELVFYNLPSDSLLGDVFFKADYRLKSICTFPDARDKFPLHLTEQEFMQREETARNYRLPGGGGAGVGHTLIPADVQMRVSPAGDVVEFQSSKIKVYGWMITPIGNLDKTASDFISSVIEKHSGYLTEHFDDYARAYPEWHKLSEAAKIIALARWAKKNNYTIKVTDAPGTKVSLPKYTTGFWSAVFQVYEDAGYLTFIQEGGTSFSEKEGESWIKAQPDVTFTSDVSKQLAASAVFAEQAVDAALKGDLESARDLADKSARAMTGEIDLTKLPPLEGIPIPSEPASYAAASAEAINQASECLNKIQAAQKDLAHAADIAASSPEEAAKITQQAKQVQDEAQAKLKQILNNVVSYKNDPAKAGEVVVALKNSSTVVTTVSSGSSSASQVGGTTVSKPEDWAAKRTKLSAELDEVNKQIAVTREALVKLNATIQANSKLFEEWEKSADEAFDRCVGMAADVAIDFGAGALADRYETIYDLAKKLPNKPEDLIEKYRYLASLAKRLQEAKATKDFSGLAARENKTEAEIYETMRDGIGQIIGLLGLDKTVPGAVWKYGSLAFDMAFNMKELHETWKNVSVLEANNAKLAEAVQKLAAKMQDLQNRAKDIKQKIDAGDSAASSSN